MKFVYPKKDTNLDERKTASIFGNYPLSSYNTWHGGIHIESALAPIVAISDARVIAYRLPSEYLVSGHECPQIYSNGFMLLQHDYKSAKEQGLPFYSLYNHIASKKDILGKPLVAPSFLSKKVTKIKANNTPKGVRGRSATVTEGQTKGDEIVLIPKNHIVTRNGNELLADWAKVLNVGKIESKKYYSYTFDDPFSDTIHSDIHIYSGCLKLVTGETDKYIITHDKESNTETGTGSNKMTTVSLNPDVINGALVYSTAASDFGKFGKGTCINTIAKDTEVTIVEGSESEDKKWVKIKDYEGFVQVSSLIITNTISDEIKTDTVVACDIAVKANEVIAYVGAFGFYQNEQKYSSHIELFTDAADTEITDFLNNCKEDGEENFIKYNVLSGATLEPYVKSEKEVKKGTPVRVSGTKGDYVRVKVKGLIKIIDKSKHLIAQHRGKKANGKYDYIQDKVCRSSRTRYKIKEDSFDSVNKEFNELLKKGDFVYFYSSNAGGGNLREIIIEPPHFDKEFWIDKSTLKLAEGQTATSGLETTLETDVAEIYLGEPYAVHERGNTYKKDIELDGKPAITVTDDDRNTWYFIASSYDYQEECYQHVGWMKADDTDLQKLNPFNWSQFGFADYDAGSEYVYALEDYHKAPETHPFIKEIWNTVDTDGDKILSPMEMLIAQRNPVTSERMGKMVVKHKNEWSYKPADIKKEALEFYKLGIDLEKDEDKKKELEDKRDAELEHLVDKVTNLMWWDEVQSATYTPETTERDKEYEEKKAVIDKKYSRFSIAESEAEDCNSFKESEMDTLDKEYQKGKYKEEEQPRRVPSTENVWHFNANSFVRQMRNIYPQGKIGNCETLIWGNKLNCTERKRVLQMSENLGIGKNKLEGANWLMAVMALETVGKFNHKEDNGIGYVGLVQFGKAAATDVGTTQKDLVTMTRLKQLDYVEKWIERKKNKIKCLTDIYLSVLLPNMAGKGNEKDLVLWTSDREAYYNNPAFHKEEGEWENLSHRGKYNKKGKKIMKRGYSEKGTTYMWEVTKEIENWYNKGLKEQNDCNDGSCTLNTVDSGEIIKSDLDIEIGINWLESLAVTKADLDAEPTTYIIPYSMESEGLRSNNTTGLVKMDCSELVCRYLNKIGWSSEVKRHTTLDLKNLADNNPNWLEKHDVDYKPKIGDIFVWRTHKGHTGVIVGYNETDDSVTTIEAISEDECPSRTGRGENSGHEGYNFRGVIKWKWNKRTGRHLTGHKSNTCRFYTPKIHHTKQDK